MIIVLAALLAAAQADENPAAPGLDPSPALVQKLAAALAVKGPDFHPNTRHLDGRGRPLFTNRLILETSPYLLQHANNPVSCYAWGDEPFARAAREHKPVLLSVGYSTCHWCHVMERESFEDLEVARYLNENYIAIKVDREERPDVDGIYMAAVEMLTGNGGWPMTTALTPDRQPFFGGTYFPRERFLDVLQQLRRVYDKDPARVATVAKELSHAVQENAQPAQPGKLPRPEVLHETAERLARSYDPLHGGFGGAPKFPTPVNLELLLRYHRRTGDPQALKMVVHTLEAMAAGGIYDQLGGGFHRYSTDVQWLKPHFEKMLYDNAQLAIVYLEASQVTGRADLARVVRETLDSIARDMTDPRGGFWSASDADSPGPDGEEIEGYSFTWTPGEIEAVLGKKRGVLVEGSYGVSERGDLDGRSIVRHVSDVPEDARKQLLSARSKRAPAAIDRKIIPFWNGLRACRIRSGRTALQGRGGAGGGIRSRAHRRQGPLPRRLRCARAGSDRFVRSDARPSPAERGDRVAPHARRALPRRSGRRVLSHSRRQAWPARAREACVRRRGADRELHRRAQPLAPRRVDRRGAFPQARRGSDGRVCLAHARNAGDARGARLVARPAARSRHRAAPRSLWHGASRRPSARVPARRSAGHRDGRARPRKA